MTRSATPTYTLSGRTTLPFAKAVQRVRETLSDEGFGVLTEIDVQATLKAKLGEDREPYLILGACSPPDAHQVLQAEPEVGALLPCNVVIYRQDGDTRVSAVDPVAMLALVGNPALEAAATEIRARIERALMRVWEA